MNQITSITQLLTLSNCQYRIYDLGRRISKISKSDFEKIEENRIFYPFPNQGHAQLAITFWQSTPSQPFIWFVKLPIDEQGYVMQAARNHFIGIIVEALGSDLSQDPSERQEELLKNNPYHFTPAQYKLASFNAMMKASLKQPSSSQYEHCQLYMSGKLGWDNWQGVGIQGLCDFAARINEENNESSLIGALPNLPIEVLSPLVGALENQMLSVPLIEAVLNQVNLSLANDELTKTSLLVRALSSSAEIPLAKSAIQALIKSDRECTIDLLIAIAARCWLALDTEEIVMQFLEKLASHKNTQQFIALFSDIIALSELRPILLTCIRSPNRSPELSQAVGALFTQVKQ